MAGPLQQFEIKPLAELTLGGMDVSFTNSSAWMFGAVACATLLTVFAVNPRALVPGRMQLIAEMCYGMVAGMVRDNVGDAGRKYFPFIFSIFMFVLFCNLLGMIPYSFTVTSHIAVTFAMAAVVFVGVTLIGLFKHGFKFFGLFFPHGAPPISGLIIVPIEVISYFSRPISLSVRLFANMTAGHIILKVLAGFIIQFGVVVAPIMIPALVGVTALEFLVAAIQAYIFTILTCIYLNDSLNLH